MNQQMEQVPVKNLPPKQFNLSAEEKEVLQNLRKEATLYRAYPLSAISGILTHFGLGRLFPKMNPIGRLSLTVIACFIGNGIGKLSYMQTVLERLKTDLPEDSELRKQAIEMEKKQKLSSGDSKMFQAKQQSEDINNFGMEVPTENHEILPNEFQQTVDQYQTNVGEFTSRDESGYSKNTMTTYNDLRKKYRQENSSNFVPNPSVVQPSSGEGLTEYSKQQRYNKYGDLIIEP